MSSVADLIRSLREHSPRVLGRLPPECLGVMWAMARLSKRASARGIPPERIFVGKRRKREAPLTAIPPDADGPQGAP